MKSQILVAEDDPAWQTFFRSILSHLDFESVVVESWSEVYSRLSRANKSQLHYGGIILDLGLGVEATLGFEELGTICSLTSSPILVTTATPDPIGLLAKRCLAVNGVNHFARKANFQTLLKEVGELVGVDVEAKELSEAILQGNVSLKTKVKVGAMDGKLRRVFVVHGQNLFARKGLFEFLRALELTPLEWGVAVEYSGKPAPFIKDVIDRVLKECGAVVVLFTPDDDVIIRQELRHSKVGSSDKKRQFQARPNVLFELGLAMAVVPDRVILVEIGQSKIPSDLHGIHLVRLNNSAESRNELAKRLEMCGCPVQTRGSDWLTAGELKEQY